MNVYAIERPDAEGSRKIALAVYREILDAHHWPFPAEPRRRSSSGWRRFRRAT